MTATAATSPLDLVTVLDALRRKRLIFSSEADFQLALGWEIQIAHPDARIRMEYRPAYLDRRGYLDLWAAGDGWAAAIELKYFTRALDVPVDGERFELLNQGAQDVSRYDFVRDLERVESVARAQPGVRGSPWRSPTTARTGARPRVPDPLLTRHSDCTRGPHSVAGWSGPRPQARERPVGGTRPTYCTGRIDSIGRTTRRRHRVLPEPSATSS